MSLSGPKDERRGRSAKDGAGWGRKGGRGTRGGGENGRESGGTTNNMYYTI